MANFDEVNTKLIQKHLTESSKVTHKVANECIKSILATIELIISTFTAGNKVLICGNGGSAADSQHMASEFVCSLNKSFNRSGLPAIALTTNTSILTAYANDVDFDGIFRRQIQTLGKPGDILLAISTSGSSPNIIFAVESAKSAKIHTIALTGSMGNLKKVVEIAISVPSNNTQYIQESHLAIEHIICELVEHHVFTKKGDRESKHGNN